MGKHGLRWAQVQSKAGGRGGVEAKDWGKQVALLAWSARGAWEAPAVADCSTTQDPCPTRLVWAGQEDGARVVHT